MKHWLLNRTDEWLENRFLPVPGGLQCKIGCQWFPCAKGIHHWMKLVCSKGTGGNQILKKDVWISSQYLIYYNNNDSANNNNNFYNYLISVIFCRKGLVSCVLGPVCVWLEVIDLSWDFVVFFAHWSLLIVHLSVGSWACVCSTRYHKSTIFDKVNMPNPYYNI